MEKEPDEYLEDYLSEGYLDDEFTINDETAVEFIEILPEDADDEDDNYIDYVVVTTIDMTGEHVRTVFSRVSLKEAIQTLREADAFLSKLNKRRKS